MTTHQNSSSEGSQFHLDVVPPNTSGDELEKKVKYALSSKIAAAGTKGKVYKSSGIGGLLFQEQVNNVLALLATERQELLKRIEGELPEKYVIQDALVKGAINYSQVGWNNALEAVQAIINAIRESI